VGVRSRRIGGHFAVTRARPLRSVSPVIGGDVEEGDVDCDIRGPMARGPFHAEGEGVETFCSGVSWPSIDGEAVWVGVPKFPHAQFRSAAEEEVAPDGVSRRRTQACSSVSA